MRFITILLVACLHLGALALIPEILLRGTEAAHERNAISRNPLFLGLPVRNFLYNQAEDKIYNFTKQFYDSLSRTESKLLKQIAPIQESIHQSTLKRDELLRKNLRAQEAMLRPVNDLTSRIGEHTSTFTHALDAQASKYILAPVVKFSEEVKSLERRTGTDLAREFELAFCVLHPQCCLKQTPECAQLRQNPL